MTTQMFLSRRGLACRWGVSVKTVDRMRAGGRLPWVNLGSAKASKTTVRFALTDVETFEQGMRQSAEDHNMGEDDVENN